MKTMYTLLVAMMFSLPLVACDNDGPAEEAGEEIDEAAEEAGEALDDAADQLEESAEEATDD
ncbi:hypothetical protein [Saccharospirillum salsuginis]|uniref:Uncharacterized protein n=1 Tax=Saccharospirillum salsuginis TaxID=418750 RepID=A0A918N4M3_9GAMM|nr:hypothetical protein [Saccharospirillum salsuginis]GGX38729.1 hypothetical protein GCM10007392_01180 [Saccharospirillum salsuginis]